MKNYTWLLFDLDGTLLDFAKTEASALQQSVEKSGHRFQETHLAIYREINRLVWQELEQGLLTPDELKIKRSRLFLQAVELDDMPERFNTHYLEHLAAGGWLLDGAKEVVQTLFEDFQLAVITNGLKEVQRRRLAVSGIGDYFQSITISDEIGVAKPDPAIFDAAFAAMGHPAKSEVLIIGDSLSSDIAGGSNYGIDTCWLNPGQMSPPAELRITCQISHLIMLPELLKEYL